MSKWFEDYDQAYAFLCESGYSWAQYGKFGWQHRGGRTCGVSDGAGASVGKFLVTISHR